MITALLLAASLSSTTLASLTLAAPPDEPEPVGADAPAPTLEHGNAGSAAYQQALERVQLAMNKANEDPVSGATALRDALSLLRGFAAELGEDPIGQELRTLAQLTLARALLASNDAEGSREAMDEAIRTARGDPLPTKSFGPGLAALHREREGVLGKRGDGSLAIECHTPCQVFLNERPIQPRASDLVPGDYRLWVEADDGSVARIERIVTVEPGQTVELEFGAARRPDPDAGPSPTPPPSPTHARRLLPRWADLLLVSAGVAAIGTGAALWAIDGRCPGGADPNDTAACPQVYTTKTAGIATVAIGGAALLAGTVTLSIDEVRTARGRASAVSLVWTTRF